MGRGKLTTEEICLLSQNPNVYDVTEKRIIYTEEFKVHFIEEYLSGKGPTKIFREAGFNPKVLGAKRIERAAARWRKDYCSGTLGSGKKNWGSYREEENIKQKLIDELKAENELLRKQLDSGGAAPKI